MAFVRILVLAIALVHAMGIADALELPCAEECADGDDCGDDCAPTCPTCQCTRAPAGVAAVAESAAFPLRGPPVAAGFRDVDRVVSSPDPREILHVPIARLV